VSEVGGAPFEEHEGSGDSDRHDSVRRRERLLSRAFVRLTTTLADEFDVVEFMHILSVDSVEILDAEAASVMLADARGGLRLIASSQERMQLLELFEIQSAQGPCLDAFGSGQIVQASATDSLGRWPVFATQASRAGFRAMCAVPLRARADTIGALNLYRLSDQQFSQAELEAAQALAQLATIAVVYEWAMRERSELNEQLQAALRGRIVIEQAKGMLAEHLSTTVDDAFGLLTAYAHDHRRRLTDVARDVVDRRLHHDELARQRG